MARKNHESVKEMIDVTMSGRKKSRNGIMGSKTVGGNYGTFSLKGKRLT